MTKSQLTARQHGTIKGKWGCTLAMALCFAAGCDAPKPTAPAEDKPKKISASEQAALVAARVKEMAAEAKKTPKGINPKDIICPAKGLLFSDAALEKEIRKKLGKPEGRIKAQELRKVRSVNLTSAKVDYLDPCIFPKLSGLRHLYLGAGALTDLSPLKGLIQLEGLTASKNAVVDIAPLSGMVKMDQLDLGRTQVRDLSPLKGMKRMTELVLDETPIRDLAPLAGLSSLERLSVKRTRVTDISMLKTLKKLKSLHVGGSPIDNPFVLGSLMKQGLKVNDKP